MPIDIVCIRREEVDRLVASPLSPSLLYAAAGSGGASSPTQTLIVSLPSVATNEVEEISLLSVASSLPAESLPTVAADPMVASVSLLNTASTAAIQAPAAIANLQFATVATTSSSARTPSNGGPRSFAVSDSLANSCNTETTTIITMKMTKSLHACLILSMVLPKRAVVARLILPSQAVATKSPERDLGLPLIQGNSSGEKSRKKPTSQSPNSNRESTSKMATIGEDSCRFAVWANTCRASNQDHEHLI